MAWLGRTLRGRFDGRGLIQAYAGVPSGASRILAIFNSPADPAAAAQPRAVIVCLRPNPAAG